MNNVKKRKRVNDEHDNREKKKRKKKKKKKKKTKKKKTSEKTVKLPIIPSVTASVATPHIVGKKKMFRCSGCTQKFVSATAHNKHECAHASRMVFSCTHENCPSRHVTKDGLTKHIKNMHTGKVSFYWSCPASTECKFKTRFKPNLKRHINNKHTITPPSFFCPYTDCVRHTVGFREKWDLQQHEFTHDDKKRYKCRYRNSCTQGFKLQSNRAHHEKTVHKNKTATRRKYQRMSPRNPNVFDDTSDL